MPGAKHSIGRQAEGPSALSKELLGILAVGATLLVGQVSAFSLLRADIADVRGEIGDLRGEMHAEIDGLRERIDFEVGGLREDVADLRERMARLETHVTIIREDVAFLSGRRESPSQPETPQ